MRPWAFALLYTALSLGTEIVLLVVFGLKVPRDNPIIAPIVLTGPPVAAALLARCQSVGRTAVLALLVSVLTVVTTVVVTRITGKSVGLLEPLLARPAAGILAAAVVHLLPASRRRA